LLPSLGLLRNWCRQMTEQQHEQKERISTLEAECDLLRTQASVDMSAASSVAVETDAAAEQVVDDSLQVNVDTLLAQISSLKEERDAVSQKLLLAETSSQETLDAANNNIRALEVELATEREEFLTRCKSVEGDQEKMATLLSQQTDELHSCKAQLEATTVRLSAVTDKCNDLESTLSAVEQDRDAFKEESIALHTELERLKQTYEQTSASLKSRIEELEVHLTLLKDENQTLTTNYGAAVDLQNTQTETISQLRSHIEDLDGHIRSLNGELESVGLSLSSSERKYEDLQQLLAGTSADAAGKLDTLTGELKSVAEEKLELVQKLADASEDCADLQSRLETASEERNDAEVKLREAENERTELQKTLNDQREAFESLQKEWSCVKDENRSVGERCSAFELAVNTVKSQLDNQLQLNSVLKSENLELLETQELMLTENGCLKQKIAEYVDKEQLEREKWTSAEQQLSAKVADLEAAVSAIEIENSALKSEVERIPLLTEELASVSVERDDAHRRRIELEADLVKLRESVESINHEFEVSSQQLTETNAELTQRCEEAECEVDKLRKVAAEKTASVLDLKSALERAEAELAESQKERDSLLSTLASERNAVTEQAAANDTVISELKSRLCVADEACCKLEQVEKELALKCEELKEAENQLEQQQQSVGSANSLIADGELDADIRSPQHQLRLDLINEWSSHATEGSDELEMRLCELDAVSDVKADSSASSEISVCASQTYTKLASTDAHPPETGANVTDDVLTPVVTDAVGLSWHCDDAVPAARASGTYTKLVSADSVMCQTEPETDAVDLYSQIRCLQLELEQEKSAHSNVMEKLQAELAEARDVHVNSGVSELPAEETSLKANRSSSVGDRETIRSHINTELEAEFKQRYESAVQAFEIEYREKLQSVQEECDRQVTAAENRARAMMSECRPPEFFAVESGASSTDGDSTAHVSDVVSQRDQLMSDLAEKTNELSKLREEIEQLRGVGEKLKVRLAENVKPCAADELDEERQRTVAKLESQLLMSTEENEQLLQTISEMQQQQQHLSDAVSAARREMEEQHVTEIKVLEFRLQESYEQRMARTRADVEAEFEEMYRKRKEALDAEFRKKSEHFRTETEHKFLQELQRVCIET